MSELVFPPTLESLQRRLTEVNPHFVDLINLYQPMKQELVQKRTEFARKNISEQIRPPEETRAIREAMWVSEAEAHSGLIQPGAQAEWLDFESDPELSARFTLGLYQRAMTSSPTRIRTHSLLHEEREITYQGRHVPSFLLNLALLGGSHILVLPKLDGRHEARALSEILHFWQGRTSIRPRLGIEFETVQAVAEADEILFELKDFVVLATFDPLDYLSNLIRRLSTQSEVLFNPFQEADRLNLLIPIQNQLIGLAERRKVQWVTHPSAEDLPRQSAASGASAKLAPFRKPTDAEVSELIREGLLYLISAFQTAEKGTKLVGQDISFARFEFDRSVLWQWILHEAVSEELYFRLREQEVQKLGSRSAELAGELLDSLLLNGNFVEFAGAYSDLHRRMDL